MGKILQGGAAGGNCLSKDVSDMAHKFVQPRIMAFAADQGAGLAAGRQACTMQRFADIDIAEPCDDVLVEQCRLERRCLATEPLRQVVGIEGIAERLDPDPAQKLVGLSIVPRDEVHDAKAAGIGIDDPGSIIEADHHMIVRPLSRVSCRGLKIEFTEVTGALFREHSKPACHAQMDEQQVARIQGSQYVLRAP